MKYLALIVFASLAFFSVQSVAQPNATPKAQLIDSTKFLIFEDVSAGPYVTGGISRTNEKLEPGWYSQSKLAYMFGGLAMLSVNEWIGVQLGVLYDARELYNGVKYSGSTLDSMSMDLSLGYLSIQPSIRIFWLVLGLSFNIPMSGSATEFVDRYRGTSTAYSINRNAEVQDLATLTELRAGLSIPFYRSDAGQINFVASASYPLGKTVLSTASFDSTGSFSSSRGPSFGQGPLPTVQAGITYQFDLLH